MSYQSIDALANDLTFMGRVRACTTEQAETYRNDARPPFVALANDVLRGGGATLLAFVRILAAGPGLADTAGDPPDQSNIADADILAGVQANWETVAGLYYDADGAALTF